MKDTIVEAEKESGHRGGPTGPTDLHMPRPDTNPTEMMGGEEVQSHTWTTKFTPSLQTPGPLPGVDLILSYHPSC